MLSHVQISATLWTIAWQAPLSMEFPKQEYWSGLSFPPGDLPNPAIQSASPALAGGFFTTALPGKPKLRIYFTVNFESLFLLEFYMLLLFPG